MSLRTLRQLGIGIWGCLLDTRAGRHGAAHSFAGVEAPRNPRGDRVASVCRRDDRRRVIGGAVIAASHLGARRPAANCPTKSTDGRVTSLQKWCHVGGVCLRGASRLGGVEDPVNRCAVRSLWPAISIQTGDVRRGAFQRGLRGVLRFEADMPSYVMRNIAFLPKCNGSAAARL